MEGNDCYKFSTIRHFTEAAGEKPVRVAVDVGVNVGDILVLIRSYFPNARIYGYEAVEEYLEVAKERTASDRRIKLFHRALTSEHRFYDDRGRQSRPRPVGMRVIQAGPQAGAGWVGGSIVVPRDHEMVRRGKVPSGFALTGKRVTPIGLDGLVANVLKDAKADEIDVLKLDCEGCEHSALGAADPATLRKLRFIVGEYHGIKRFYGVMDGKLFQTHKVNLIGDSSLGAFFAERLNGTQSGILRFDKTGMLQLRPWLCDIPIDWHLFGEQYVLPEERAIHALP